MKKKPLLVIVGPTASGKSSLGIELAKIYNGEIISADSMQIYKGMDIATAKPTIEEMDGVVHHLISEIENNKEFSVAQYLDVARKKIDCVHQKGKLPIVVGGTGLYINSLIDNIQFDDTSSNEQLRNKLHDEAKEKGNAYLLQKLYEIDKETAITLHENNLTRIIRAIEFYESTGTKISDQKILSRSQESMYNTCIIGINYEDRNDLYSRINYRVDLMIKSGLIEEAREIYENSDLKTAVQAIGYKELIPYFENKSSLEECIEHLKQQTRRYAKRQLTWFRRDDRINWIILNEIDNVSNYLIKKSTEIIEKAEIL